MGVRAPWRAWRRRARAWACAGSLTRSAVYLNRLLNFCTSARSSRHLLNVSNAPIVLSASPAVHGVPAVKLLAISCSPLCQTAFMSASTCASASCLVACPARVALASAGSQYFTMFS